MFDLTLLIALGLPTLIVVVSTLLLQRYPDSLPTALRCLARHPSQLWNIGVGVIIALSALAAVLLLC